MNKDIYNENYTTYFETNYCTFYMYKSSRKNCKCESFAIRHLISHNDDRKLDDKNIESYFVSTLEKIVYQSKKYNNYLEVAAYMNFDKQCSFVNANNDNYFTFDRIPLNIARKNYSSLENVINLLYSIFAIIYPYNKLCIESLYNNPSVKYLIDFYYHGEV